MYSPHHITADDDDANRNSTTEEDERVSDDDQDQVSFLDFYKGPFIRLNFVMNVRMSHSVAWFGLCLDFLLKEI